MGSVDLGPSDAPTIAASTQPSPPEAPPEGTSTLMARLQERRNDEGSEEGAAVKEGEQAGPGWGSWATGTASSWGTWAKSKTNAAVTAASTVTAVAVEVAGAVADEQRRRVRGEAVVREDAGEAVEELDEEQELCIGGKLVRHEELCMCGAMLADALLDSATTAMQRNEIMGEESTTQLVSALVDPANNEGYHVAIARTSHNNQIVGLAACNTMDAAQGSCGVGPLCVQSSMRERVVATSLLRDLLERCQGCRSFRVVQDAFDLSFAALTGEGFRIVEPLALIGWQPQLDKLDTLLEDLPAFTLRAMTLADAEECSAIGLATAKVDRRGSIEHMLRASSDAVVLVDSEGRLAGYSTRLGNLTGHTAARCAEAAKALLIHGAKERPLRTLLPVRTHPELFAWCLSVEMQVVKMCNLMVSGEYHEFDSQGCYFPEYYNP